MPSFNITSVMASFFAGILTFASPCILPMIPAYISFITGESIDELTRREGSYRRTFIDALLFVAGFTVVFVLLGASASYLGNLLGGYRDYLRWIGGAVVIIFGLHTAGLFHISFLYRQTRMTARPATFAFLEPFLVGVAFAIGWTPCVGPILSSILILASTQETVAQGMFMLTVYSFGLGVPFLLTALFINAALRVFGSVKRWFRTIEIVSGIVLIIVGFLIMIGGFEMITTLILRATMK